MSQQTDASRHAWVDAFPGAITVCAPDGTILEMNGSAALMFAKDGGLDLIGRNVLDCHPGASKAKLQALMDQRVPNAYTIEKRGKKKLIYQCPWFEQGEYRGYMEMSLELPAELPHFKRD